jgi:GNAT superfamily N-acetyltransferase
MITGLAIIEYQTLLIVSEATVSNFVISPDYRMKGFGKQMLIKIIDYIRSHNSVVNSLVIPISESMESWLQEKLIKNGFNLNQLTNTLNLIIS